MEIKSRTGHYKNLSLSSLREYVSGVGWVIEKWKDVVGYEGYYAVSTFGRVRSYERMVYRERFDDYVKRRERMLKQKDTRGYLSVVLQVDKKKKIRLVHILVCSAFIPNIKNKEQVNHKFGNKKDNRVSKLEWLTPKENTQHAIRLGIAPSQIGEINNKSKLTESDVINIRKESKNGVTGVALAKEYKVYPTAINKIIHKKTWKHIA